MLNYLRKQVSQGALRIRGVFHPGRETGDPLPTQEPNALEIPNSTVLDMAWSAIMAGEKSTCILAKSPQVGEITADREETVLSGLEGNSPTAEDWIRWYGRNGGIEDDNLGGGTPFVCLYLCGGILGKHTMAWAVGAIPLVSCWVCSVYLSMKSNLKAGDLWLEDVAVFIMTNIFFAFRVHARTPPGFKGSNGVWVAVLLEAVLTSTLSCIAHGFGLIVEGPEGLPGSRMVIRFSKYISLLGGWSAMCRIAENRQAAVLRKRNLGNIGPRGPPEEPHWNIVETYLKKIMDRSRDLRVTGLSAKELETLAKRLEDGVNAQLARCIRFFTRKGNTMDTFDLLLAFHRGYTNCTEERNAEVLPWVTEHGLSSFNSVDSILTLRDDSQSLPCELVGELDQIRNRQSSGDSEDEREKRWCLCGAIASYLDHGGEMRKRSDDFSWYALAAAVLCEKRNALAVMEARRSRIDERRDVDEMCKNMARGCQQVLKKVTDDQDISSERGIVVTTTRAGSKWAMFYTPAEVWRAEQEKEVVIFDTRTFSLLLDEDTFRAPHDTRTGDGRMDLLGVKEDPKSDILGTSVKMASNMDARVEFVACIAYLRVQRLAMANVRASAQRGWIVHTVWVACAIVIQIAFPENLLYLSTFSFLGTSVDRTDLQVHVVYVGVHIWRSWIGKIALWSPFANMDDTDINSVATWAYWAAVVIVNWVGVEFGRHPGLWCRICFLVIVISSTIPGFLYLVRERDTEGTDGSITYVGRKRGPGYEHRDNDLRGRSSYGPVGKDVIVEGSGGFTIASALRQEAGDVDGNEAENRDVSC